MIHTSWKLHHHRKELNNWIEHIFSNEEVKRYNMQREFHKAKELKNDFFLRNMCEREAERFDRTERKEEAGKEIPEL